MKISYITICEALAITSCRSFPLRSRNLSPTNPSFAFHELRSFIAIGFPVRNDCDSYESFPSGKFLLLKAKFDHDRRGCVVNWLIGLLWTRWWMKFVVGSLLEFSAMKVVVELIRLLKFQTHKQHRMVKIKHVEKTIRKIIWKQNKKC